MVDVSAEDKSPARGALAPTMGYAGEAAKPVHPTAATVGFDDARTSGVKPATGLDATIGFGDAKLTPPRTPVAKPATGFDATIGFSDAKPTAPRTPAVKPANGIALDATVGFSDAHATPAPTAASVSPRTSAVQPAIGLDATMAHDSAVSPDVSISRSGTMYGSASGRVTATRTTVLPRVRMVESGHAIEISDRPRYEEVKALGAGGVGEVVLAQDRDIERPVALKRLRADMINDTTLLRFAEEIRTIGRLEHPNIVPVHDVGLDERGQHYFVMKYVEGETIEQIIEKLAAGDPAYLARYPYAMRTRIFLGVLQAIQYAHAQGIVHRDIKPANVMVGPYGEVMVMDWGLAKKIRGRESDVDLDKAGLSTATVAAREPENERDRIFKTRHGSLLGTPAYMSPEQARGQNDSIDERSDVYSLGVMFYELLTLRHYLADAPTVPAILTSIVTDEPFDWTVWMRMAESTGVPAELLHFVRKAMEKDRAKRYQSVEEMKGMLEAVAAGEIPVQCPVTLIKRGGNDLMHWIDRNPRLGMFTVYGTVTTAVVGVLGGVAALIAHFV